MDAFFRVRNQLSTFLIGLASGCIVSAALSPYLPDVRHFIRAWLIKKQYKPRLDEADGDVVLQLDMPFTVLLSDVDHNCHMNNAKYIMVLNFSRRALIERLGLWSAARKLKCSFVVVAQSIRYRREMKLWQKYRIQCCIRKCSELEQCMYVESKFVDGVEAAGTDRFVFAIHYAKYRLVPLHTSSKDSNNTSGKDSGSSSESSAHTRRSSVRRLLEEAKLHFDFTDAPWAAADAGGATGAASVSEAAAGGEEDYICHWERGIRACSRSLRKPVKH